MSILKGQEEYNTKIAVKQSYVKFLSVWFALAAQKNDNFLKQTKCV